MLQVYFSLRFLNIYLPINSDSLRFYENTRKNISMKLNQYVMSIYSFNLYIHYILKEKHYYFELLCNDIKKNQENPKQRLPRITLNFRV